MANAVEAKIMEALFTRLSTVDLDPLIPDLTDRIAWPERNFTAPADGKYLEGVFIPNGNERQHINSDGAHRFIGLLQVSVHWPSGVGAVAPTRVACAVADHFPADLILVEEDVAVRITKRPDVAESMTQPTGPMVPVTIDYEVYD